MVKLLDALNGLFNKVDNTEQRYEKALELKEESVLVLQAEIQDKQIEITELHKMKVLGDISPATFDEKNEKFQLLKANYDEAKNEVALIQEFKNEDVMEILAELKATQREYSASEREAIKQMHLELLESKLAYLNKMNEVRERYNKTVAPSLRIQQLERKFIHKQNVYHSGSHETLHQYSVPGDGYIGLRVENPDVYNALSYGQIHSQLQKIVADAKAKGLLK